MDKSKVLDDLRRRFAQHRIVFWHDTEQVYSDELDDLLAQLPEVTVIHLDQEAHLGVKVRVELDEPEQSFLLFSEKAKPAPKDDWLLDIRLYADEVSVGFAAMVLDELGLRPALQLTLQGLRDFIDQHRAFFKSRQRTDKLKRILDSLDDQVQLERKMLAVLLKTDRHDSVSLLIQVFDLLSRQFESADDIDWSQTPGGWNDVVKFGLEGAFWSLVMQDFSYGPEVPSLRHLLSCLLVTDFNYSVLTTLPAKFESKILKGPRATNNTVVMLSTWRDSTRCTDSYNELSKWAENELEIPSVLRDIEIEHLLEVKTFAEVEKHIASVIRERLLHENTLEHPHLAAAPLQKMIQRRLDGYWASPMSNNIIHQCFNAVYMAFEAALKLFVEVAQFKLDASDDAGALYRGYEQQYHLCDRYYRIFTEKKDFVSHWAILSPLAELVEKLYVNGFMTPFAGKWDQLFGGEFLSRWKLAEVPNQYDFYKRHVANALAVDPKRTVFVIISDALRYEVATELRQSINSISRVSAKLSSQLGVLPSYTALGKAALLPRKQDISYQEKVVKVDGLNCTRTEDRGRILSTVGGCALDFSEARAMNKAQGREQFKDQRVIYIYHDAIDAKGDKRATEHETFMAVRQTIQELTSLVTKIVNSWNGTQVIITSDHGFIYQTSEVSELDKSDKVFNSGHIVDETKRYVLGSDLVADGAVHKGALSITSGVSGHEEFVLPKGVHRFHFVGGARFVHGGLLAQEVVVPVIDVRLKRGSSAQKQRVSNVEVAVLGDNHRITTPTHYFTFLQTSVVSDKVKPMPLRAEVRDSSGQAVSDYQLVMFDSASQSMDERKKRVRFTLKGSDFDRKKQYYLILENAESRTEIAVIPVIIDISFADDF